MANIDLIRIGVCSVTYKSADLGHTKGGVTISYEPNIVDVGVDQYGSTPVDKILAGEKAQIKVRLAEQTAANLNVAMPGTEKETGAQGTKVEVGANAGKSLRALGGELVLHPIDKSAGDLSEDWTFYKVVAVDTVELNYAVEDQRIIEVTFEALVDETKSVGNRLGHYGVASIS